jgi:surfactin synthase thioesterase subunit
MRAGARIGDYGELLNLMSPTIRADFELSETYERHPESPLEWPMTIYGGPEDHEVEAVRSECFPAAIFTSTVRG